MSCLLGNFPIAAKLNFFPPLEFPAPPSPTEDTNSATNQILWTIDSHREILVVGPETSTPNNCNWKLHAIAVSNTWNGSCLPKTAPRFSFAPVRTIDAALQPNSFRCTRMRVWPSAQIESRKNPAALFQPGVFPMLLSRPFVRETLSRQHGEQK